MSGLASVQGAISITWVIYSLYLPQLLAQVGLSAALATSFLIAENFLGALLEPLMGGLSDQAKRWMGTRFPFISVGVILSSALFIALPAIVIFGNPTDAARSVLPVVAIAWAVAMTVFRSPAVSLLGQYATPAALPLAASLLTLSGGLIAAFRPFANKLVLGLGPAVTFAIGSFVLLGAAFSLIVNGVIPFVLSVVPPQRSGLGIGMYFGGSAAAAGLFGLVFTQSSLMAPITTAFLGAIAFFVAGLCIAASTKVNLQALS